MKEATARVAQTVVSADASAARPARRILVRAATTARAKNRPTSCEDLGS